MARFIPYEMNDIESITYNYYSSMFSPKYSLSKNIGTNIDPNSHGIYGNSFSKHLEFRTHN